MSINLGMSTKHGQKKKQEKNRLSIDYTKHSLNTFCEFWMKHFPHIFFHPPLYSHVTNTNKEKGFWGYVNFLFSQQSPSNWIAKLNRIFPKLLRYIVVMWTSEQNLNLPFSPTQLKGIDRLCGMSYLIEIHKIICVGNFPRKCNPIHWLFRENLINDFWLPMYNFSHLFSTQLKRNFSLRKKKENRWRHWGKYHPISYDFLFKCGKVCEKSYCSLNISTFDQLFN